MRKKLEICEIDETCNKVKMLREKQLQKSRITSGILTEQV